MASNTEDNKGKNAYVPGGVVQVQDVVSGHDYTPNMKLNISKDGRVSLDDRLMQMQAQRRAEEAQKEAERQRNEAAGMVEYDEDGSPYVSAGDGATVRTTKDGQWMPGTNAEAWNEGGERNYWEQQAKNNSDAQGRFKTEVMTNPETGETDMGSFSRSTEDYSDIDAIVDKGIGHMESGAMGTEENYEGKTNISQTAGASPATAIMERGQYNKEYYANLTPDAALGHLRMMLLEPDVMESVMAGAEKRGMNVDTYLKDVLYPRYQERIYDYLVKRGAPKSTLEYIASGALESMFGKILELGIYDKTQRQIMEAGRQQYGEMAGTMAQMANSAVALTADALPFAVFGAIGSGVAGVTGSLMKGVAQKGLTNYAFATIQSGLMMGQYDFMNETLTQMHQQGEIDLGEAAKHGAMGIGTGAALGIFGIGLNSQITKYIEKNGFGRYTKNVMGKELSVSKAGTYEYLLHNAGASAILTTSGVMKQLALNPDYKEEDIDYLQEMWNGMCMQGAIMLSGIANPMHNRYKETGATISKETLKAMQDAGYKVKDEKEAVDYIRRVDRKLEFIGNAKLSVHEKNDILRAVGIVVTGAKGETKPFQLPEGSAVRMDVVKMGENEWHVRSFDTTTGNGNMIDVQRFSTEEEARSYKAEHEGEVAGNRMAQLLLADESKSRVMARANAMREVAEESNMQLSQVDEIMRKKDEALNDAERKIKSQVLNVEESYLQITLNEREKASDKIEQKYGKERGWVDELHDKAWGEMNDEERQAWLDYMDEMELNLHGTGKLSTDHTNSSLQGYLSDEEIAQCREQGRAIYLSDDYTQQRGAVIDAQVERDRLVSILGEDVVGAIDRVGLMAVEPYIYNRYMRDRVVEYIKKTEVVEGIRRGVQEGMKGEMDAVAETVKRMSNQRADDGSVIVTIVRDGVKTYIVRSQAGELMTATEVETDENGKIIWTSYDDSNCKTMRWTPRMTFDEVDERQVLNDMVPGYGETMEHIFGAPKPEVGAFVTTGDNSQWTLIGQDINGDWTAANSNGESIKMTDEQVRDVMSENERMPYELEYKRRNSVGEPLNTNEDERPQGEPANTNDAAISAGGPLNTNEPMNTKESTNTEEQKHDASDEFRGKYGEDGMNADEKGNVRYRSIDDTVSDISRKMGGNDEAALRIIRNKRAAMQKDLDETSAKMEKVTSLTEASQLQQRISELTKALEYWAEVEYEYTGIVQRPELKAAEGAVHKAVRELVGKIGGMDLTIAFDMQDALRRAGHSVSRLEAQQYNGFTDLGRNIVINASTQKGLCFAVGHEICHMMKQKSPEAYDKWMDTAVKIIGDDAIHAELLKKKQDSVYGKMKDEVIIEEIVCDKMGDILSDPEKMKRLTNLMSGDGIDILKEKIRAWKEDKTNVKKWTDILKTAMVDLPERAIAHVKDYLSVMSETNKTLTEAEQVLLDALREMKRRDSAGEPLNTNDAANTNERARTKFSYIGELGHETLVSDNVKEDNLSVAEKMEAEGRSETRIKMATGWERGADGKWRYEMDDLRLLPDVLPSYEEVDNGTYSLYQMTEASQLYKAYPQLKEVSLRFRNDMDDDTLGSYDAGRTEININANLLKEGTTSVEKTLAHEVQHFIQRAEGFAKGGNSRMKINGSILRSNMSEEEQRRYDELTQKETETNSDVQDLQEQYEALVDMSFGTTDYDNLEDFLNSGEEKWSTAIRMIKDVRKDFDNARREWAMASNELERFTEEIAGKIKEEKGIVEDDGTLGYNGYRNLAGEVEARNVSKRMGMDDEYRREIIAESTEDVSRDRQILRFSKEEGAAVMEDMKDMAAAGMPEVVSMPKKKRRTIERKYMKERLFEDGEKVEIATYDGRLVTPALRGISFQNEDYLLDAVRRQYENNCVTIETRTGYNGKQEKVLVFSDWNFKGKRVPREGTKARERYDRQLEKKMDMAREHVNGIAEKFGVRLAIHENGKRMTKKQKGEKGWYETATKTIHINLDNVQSLYDLEKTMLNLAVGHHGLRELFGKRMQPMMEEIYDAMDAYQAAEVHRLMGKGKKATIADGVEEYLSRMAMNMKHLDSQPQYQSFVQRVKEMICDALSNLGFHIRRLADKRKRDVRWGDGQAITDEELMSILYKSRLNLLQENGIRESYKEERAKEDAVYMQAVESGDMATAQRLANEKLYDRMTYGGVVPFVAAETYAKGRRGAHGIKDGDMEVTRQSAEKMAQLVPDGALLVPMPGRSGKAGTTLDLTQEIIKACKEQGKRVAMADALSGAERRSQYESKKDGIILTPDDMQMRTELNALNTLGYDNVFIVDNVVATGNTAQAAIDAMKAADVKATILTLAYAKSGKAVPGLKIADAITYDNNGKVIPLSERFNAEVKDLRFSKEVNPIFVSNAGRALDGLKQEKATSEQWLAMLQKAGGIKAGEDKWMRLSEWLTSKKGEKLTKDDVMRYIAENSVQVEDVKYVEQARLLDNNTELMRLKSEYEDYLQKCEEETGITNQEDKSEWAFEQMVDTYGDDFEMAFEIVDGEFRPVYDWDGTLIEPSMYFLSMEGENLINGTRKMYTTEGLKNKREIALTVPSVEPYNEDDEVHFGDAGEGRAIAWVRFGDAVDADGNSVLFIDEVQSKRHQDGRDGGYISKESSDIEREYKKTEQELSQLSIRLMKKYGDKYVENDRKGELIDYYTEEEKAKIKELNEKAFNLQEKYKKSRTNDSNVPDAPFDKNWHELAMKRMLRLAAEEGYDKVAWTDGMTQARRYNIGNVVKCVTAGIDRSGERHTMLQIESNGYGITTISHDDNGVITEITGADKHLLTGAKNLSDVVGRDLAIKILAQTKTESEGVVKYEGHDLIGGEGMKGFYDQMLPKFMDKYGKKWGVKTYGMHIDGLKDANSGYQVDGGLNVHAIDVTPEMRESVMQGQVMFSKEASAAPMEGEHWMDYAQRIAKVEAERKVRTQRERQYIVEDEAGSNVDETGLRFSVETGITPKKTKKVYKLMRVEYDDNGYVKTDDEGNPILHPLFIDRNDIVPFKTWLKSDSPRMNVMRKLPIGRHAIDMNDDNGNSMTYKEFCDTYFGGKVLARPNAEQIRKAKDLGMRIMEIKEGAPTKRKDNLRKYGDNRQYYNWGLAAKDENPTAYAMRSGWHAGTQPEMRQIGSKNYETGLNEMRNDDEVWTECEISVDNDYTEEYGVMDVAEMPESGGYKYTTNATLRAKELATRRKGVYSEGKGNGWWLSTHLKVNRLVSDEEADRIIDEHNSAENDNLEYDYRRAGGKRFNAETMRLEDGNGGDEPGGGLRFSKEVVKRDESGYIEFLTEKERDKYVESRYKDGVIFEYGDNKKKMTVHRGMNAVYNIDIQIIDTPAKSKQESHDGYRKLKSATNKDTGEKVEFFNTMFGKNHREGGLFEKVAPYLDVIYENSILIYSEPDNLGGENRKDNTTHKSHKYSYGNYLGRIKMSGRNYYVRTTVQRQKNRPAIHSTFVTNVEVYENPSHILPGLPLTQEGVLDIERISDAKLKQFFELAKSNAEKINLSSSQFKNWFGDWEKDPEHASKVVDEEGRPLVVHHGTNRYGFTIFNTGTDWNKDNIGSHFGAKETASEFGGEDGIYNVYLDIKKPWTAPFDFFADANNNTYIEVADELAKKIRTKESKELFSKRIREIYPDVPTELFDEASRGSYLEVFDDDNNLESSHNMNSESFKRHRDGIVSLINELLDLGEYDGIKYHNWYEGGDDDICWVVRKPEQIKSADVEGDMANNGNYDPKNPDIRYSKEEDLDSIREAIDNTDVNPSDAQKKSGNYKMGHAHLDGYQITIENPAGSIRRGTDPDGKTWEVKMNYTYGYIRGTRGKDGDHIDIFLSDNPTEGNVYVVDQVNKDGSFDEHKVMYGFSSEEEARQAYLSNYEEGWQGLGNITEVSKDNFRKWIDSSTKKTKPFAEYKMAKNLDYKFNLTLEGLTKENSNSVQFKLGMPSKILVDAGVKNLPMILYGNKLYKQNGKHEEDIPYLRNLPSAINDPVAVFDTHGNEFERAVLTILNTPAGNILASVGINKGYVDVTPITSVYSKKAGNILKWFDNGRATYINEEKVLRFLASASAPIADAQQGTKPLSAAKLQQISNINKLFGEKLFIRTKNFKAWFGDWEKDPENASKVVDEEGKPLVVYKRRAEDTDVINTDFGAFFSNEPLEDRSFGDVITPVYLNIRKPLVMDANGVSWSYPMYYFLMDQATDKLPDTREEYEKVLKDRNLLKYAPKEIWDIIYESEDELDFEDAAWMVNTYKLPYDGIIINNIAEGAGGQQVVTDYIALDSNQIKHATENNGIYSKTDDRIRFSHELDRAKRELKNYPEAVRILEERIEPRDINEAAAACLQGSKLMWDDYGDGDYRQKGLRSMMGWKEGERKKYLGLIRTKENGGITLARLGEMVEDYCREENIPFDDLDANAGLNALQDVLGSCSSYGDVMRYMEQTRIDEAYAAAEHEQELERDERNEWYKNNYGMSYDEYLDWQESMQRTHEEQETGTKKDADMITWLKERNTRQANELTKLQKRLDEIREMELGRPLVQSLTALNEQRKQQLGEAKEKIRTLEDEKRHRKEYEKAYREIKEVKKQMADFVRNNMQKEDMPFVSKAEIQKLMSTIEHTNTVKQLEEALSEVREVCGKARVRHLEHRLDRLMQMKVQDVNGRNMSVAKTVDNRTRLIIEDIRGRMDELGISGMEEQLDELYRQRRAKRQEINPLTRRLREEKGDARIAIQDLIDEKEKEWRSISEQIKAKEQEISDVRESNRKTTSADITEEINQLMERFEKYMVGDEGTWTQEDADRLIALKGFDIVQQSKANGRDVSELNMQRRDLWTELYAKRVELGGLAGESESVRKPIKEQVDVLKDKIAAKTEQINAAMDAQAQSIEGAIQMLEDLMDTGRNNLKSRIDQELIRKGEILKGAVHDVFNVENLPNYEFGEKDLKKTPWYKIGVSCNTGSFEYMCKRISQSGVKGNDGFIYRYFISGEHGVMEAFNTYYRGKREQLDELNKKVTELFGTKNHPIFGTDAWTMQAFYADKVHNSTGIFIRTKDGRHIELPISKGAAAYIYAVWKMDAGKSQLKEQGWSEESIQQVNDYIGEKYIQLADWLQDEFLTASRAKYNERYEELYNTSMAKIENYIPLRRNKDAVRQENSLEDEKLAKHSMEKRAGSLINRRVNNIPVDISKSIFDVISEHVEDMENWYAYSPVRRDLDTLLGCTYFRNQLDANNAGHYERFLEAAAVATQSGKPEQAKYGDKLMSMIQKGLISGNIAYRFATAIKQTYSASAYLGYIGESGDPRFAWHLGRNLAAGSLGLNIRWAIENIPSFASRVDIGDVGNYRISEKTGKGNLQSAGQFLKKMGLVKAGENVEKMRWEHIDRILQGYTQLGMLPNRFIDALTCSIGSKSIYDYKMARLMEEIDKDATLTEEGRKKALEDAHRKAIMEADIYYNATQQSSNPAFLSPMQVSRSFTDRAMSAYQNNNLGYVRKTMEYALDILRSAKYEKMREEYTKVYKKQAEELFKEKNGREATEEEMADMLPEAQKQARQQVLKTCLGSVFGLGVAGFLNKWLWNVGSQGFFGFLADDNSDEQKEGETDEEYKLRQDWSNSLKWLGWGATPLQGTPLGNMLVTMAEQHDYDPYLAIQELTDLRDDVMEVIEKDGVINKGLLWAISNRCMRMGGFNLETLGNIYYGIEQMIIDGGTFDEKMIDLMYILNTPGNGRETAARNLYKDAPMNEYIAAVAKAQSYIQAGKSHVNWFPWMKEPAGGKAQRDNAKNMAEYNATHKDIDPEEATYDIIIAESQEDKVDHAKIYKDSLKWEDIQRDALIQRTADKAKKAEQALKAVQKSTKEKNDSIWEKKSELGEQVYETDLVHDDEEFKSAHEADLEIGKLMKDYNKEITILKKKLTGGEGDKDVMDSIRTKGEKLLDSCEKLKK